MFRSLLSLSFSKMGGASSSSPAEMSDENGNTIEKSRIMNKEKDRVIMMTAEQDAQPVKSEAIRRFIDEMSKDDDDGEGNKQCTLCFIIWRNSTLAA